MKGRIVIIFIIITLVMNSFLFSVTSQICPIDNSQDTYNPSRLMPRIFNRVLVIGYANSGKQFGIFNRSGIVKFDTVQFVIIRFFPIRLVVNEETNVTAILFGLDQEIPEGPFKFEKDWIFIAIVFKT